MSETNRLAGMFLHHASRKRHGRSSRRQAGLERHRLFDLDLSVFFLGAIAWPKPDDPRWHVAVLVAGMATSILGMGFRYKAHLDQLRELKKTEAKADGQRPRTRE